MKLQLTLKREKRCGQTVGMEECNSSVGIGESTVMEKMLPKDRLNGTVGDSCGVVLTKFNGSYQIKEIQVQVQSNTFSPS